MVYNQIKLIQSYLTAKYLEVNKNNLATIHMALTPNKFQDWRNFI